MRTNKDVKSAVERVSLSSSMKRATVVLLGLGVVVTSVGCTRDRSTNRDEPRHADESKASTQLTSAGLATKNRDAIDRIVDARCAQEKACGAIRIEGKFPTREACEEEIRRSIQGELDQDACPEGVYTQALNACLNAVHAEACGDRIESLRRFVECQPNEMCLKADRR